jgi:hypothetical protein
MMEIEICNNKTTMRLGKNGNTWKYTLDIGRLRVCWKPVKKGKKYIVFKIYKDV